ncbi:MAG: hypothetical protein HY875_11640 [Chloroflexi bacterium]|nr:hypothetical protein [Chloroflexota bacterium]
MTNGGAFDPEVDGLTPGEQHVLAMIREGRLDAEIAVRLGVSVGDVKERIQRILRKLELDERRDLLNPNAERRVSIVESEVIIGGPEEVIIGGSGPVQPPGRVAWTVLAAKVAGGAVLLGAGIFAAGWAWSMDEPSPGGNGRDASAPAETSTPAPADATKDAVIVDGPLAVTATPTVFVVNGIPAPEMKVTESAIFPESLVLYVLNTGIAPDPGQGTGLFRVYRLGGKTYSDRVFPPAGVTGQVLMAAAQADGSDIVVAVCTRGTCLGRGVDPDSEATYYRSRDGGITWAVDFVLARGFSVMGVSQGRVLVQQAMVTSTARWLVVENGVFRELTPPTLNLRYTPQRPYLGSDGKVVWLADTAVLDEDGRFLFGVPMTLVVSLTPYPRGWVVSGTSPGATPPAILTWGPGSEAQRAAATPGLLFPAAFSDVDLGAGTADASSSSAIGTGRSGQQFPVLIHMSSGTLQVLTDPFVEPPFRGLANRVIAARFASFARVNTPGDCLNIREGPSTAEPVITCVPDGVLLTLSGTSAPPAFLHAQAPDGRWGYAAMEYLIR